MIMASHVQATYAVMTAVLPFNTTPRCIPSAATRFQPHPNPHQCRPDWPQSIIPTAAPGIRRIKKIFLLQKTNGVPERVFWWIFGMDMIVMTGMQHPKGYPLQSRYGVAATNPEQRVPPQHRGYSKKYDYFMRGTRGCGPGGRVMMDIWMDLDF